MASPKAQLARRIVYMLVFGAIVYGGVIGVNRFMKHKTLAALASKQQPTVDVSVAKAQEQTWNDVLHATASISAEQGTILTAQSSGPIIELHFKSGQNVKKGTLLVQINDNIARAKLASANAQLLNAKQLVERQRKLYAHDDTSQESLQAAEAAYGEAEAAVQSAQATIDNLQIRAPFNGHLGIRDVNVGQYVSPGTSVVDIQQWNPLRVEFALPQSDLPSLSVGDRIKLSIGGISHKTFTGHVAALDSAVSSSTRTIKVEAQIDNAKDELRPGMFGEVALRLAHTTHALAVPSIAITYDTYGKYVYVIENTNKGKIAKQVIIQTGATHGNLVDVTRGLNPGDTVVIAGQVNLYPGAHVKIVDAPKGLSSSTNGTRGA